MDLYESAITMLESAIHNMEDASNNLGKHTYQILDQGAVKDLTYQFE